MLENFVGRMRMQERKSKVCANDKCSNEFVPRVYNAIYCGTACRRIVTNKKILERYHEKKAAKGRKRTCATDTCNTTLSRYNTEDICESCKRERYIMRLVGWGWDEKKLRREMS